jgi:hypothetical protein
MNRYHIVLVDEIGEEFSVTMYAEDDDTCFDLLDDEYPESRVLLVHTCKLEPTGY